MHDCVDCDVYLRCGSRGVVEGVAGVRFAPFVDGDVKDVGGGGGGGVKEEDEGDDNNDDGKQEAYASRLNKWDQIDDFKWPRAGEQSPNWSVLPQGERVEGSFWRRGAMERLAGREDEGADGDEEERRRGVEGILRAAGVRCEL